MDIKSGVSNFLITALVASLIGFPVCLFLSHRASSEGQIQFTYYKLRAVLGAREDPKSFSQSDVKELEEVLAMAASENKTVIITTLNEAWAANSTMIDLYLQSFHGGEKIEYLLGHMVIVTLDQKAHDRCLQLHPHCFRLKTSGVDFTGEKSFMSEDYLEMMWSRIQFLGEVLKLGYSFVFSDADIVWFRDPFERFFDNMDFQIACDRYYGRPFNVSRNAPNGGFVYVRSNQRTISMYKYWYEARLRNPGKHDQDVLNVILREKEFDDIGVKLRFLDTIFFSGFCQKDRRDITKVVTMHANCCKGLSNKLEDLRLALDDWRLYKIVESVPHKLEKPDPTLQMAWRAPLACVTSEQETIG
ncbi:hypothetical protein M758_5G021800 [Ceratodon purpureus]|nr:hypothetical protein M758_5G021800 [Ceratodon purpureus]